MKSLGWALLALAILVPSHGRAQALDAGKLVGRWTGEGVFFKADLNALVDSLPFVVQFETGRPPSGRVGGATFQDARITTTRSRIEIAAKLNGLVAEAPALAKDHLVLLVTAITDTSIQAEFHLKSALPYDPRMREGRVLLTRVR
jgi:hypothetical protein